MRPGVGGSTKGGHLAGVAAHRLGDGVGHLEQLRLAEPIHVAEVARVALHHSHGRAALGAALGPLDAAVVEREREDPPILRVELAQVAPARERPLDHGLRELVADEAHETVSSTISSAMSRIRSWPLEPGASRWGSPGAA